MPPWSRKFRQIKHLWNSGRALITRAKYNLKQNFNTLNISKIFEDEYEVYEEEEEVVEPEDVNKLLLTQIARNQAELLKLKTPIWLAAIFLGLLLLIMWR